MSIWVILMCKLKLGGGVETEILNNSFNTGKRFLYISTEEVVNLRRLSNGLTWEKGEYFKGNFKFTVWITFGSRWWSRPNRSQSTYGDDWTIAWEFVGWKELLGERFFGGPNIGKELQVKWFIAPVFLKSSSDRVIASSQRIIVSLKWLPWSRSGRIQVRGFYWFAIDEECSVERS